jgi:thymidylate synthase (FAD)
MDMGFGAHMASIISAFYHTWYVISGKPPRQELSKMKPIKAKDLLVLDPKLQVVKLQSYPIPEQVIWQAAKGDYSEVPVHDLLPPSPSECGKWVVESLLANERGHWGPLEHPQITFSCSGFVHNVMVQARTHRIGTSWDVQSQRYTGKRVLKVATNELDVEEVFYIRPVGLYTNRLGKKYEVTEDWRFVQKDDIYRACLSYQYDYERGMAEEHIRDYLPQCIRQNFVVSFNLRSALHFLDLRSKLDAQVEIQALCEAFVPELQKWAPSIWNYYEEKRLYKARLSP